MSPFCDATDTPHLDFCWCRPWVSKSGWIPCLHASSPVFNGFIRFTSGATPADLLTASIAAEPFWSTYLDCNLYLHILIARLFWGARFLFPGHTEPPAKCSFIPFNLISEKIKSLGLRSSTPCQLINLISSWSLTCQVQISIQVFKFSFNYLISYVFS